MMCPICQGPTKVLEMRERSDGTSRRRRVCLACNKRITTEEKIVVYLDANKDKSISKEALAIRRALRALERIRKIVANIEECEDGSSSCEQDVRETEGLQSSKF